MALKAADCLSHPSGDKLGMLHRTSLGAKKQEEQMICGRKIFLMQHDFTCTDCPCGKV